MDRPQADRWLAAPQPGPGGPRPIPRRSTRSATSSSHPAPSRSTRSAHWFRRRRTSRSPRSSSPQVAGNSRGRCSTGFPAATMWPSTDRPICALGCARCSRPSAAARWWRRFGSRPLGGGRRCRAHSAVC